MPLANIRNNVGKANLSGITDIEYVKQRREFLEGLKMEAADLYLRAKEELSRRL